MVMPTNLGLKFVHKIELCIFINGLTYQLVRILFAQELSSPKWHWPRDDIIFSYGK